MPYKVQSSEKLRKSGADFETKAMLRSLNRNIEVGELRCMDCDSTHIAYKGKGRTCFGVAI